MQSQWFAIHTLSGQELKVRDNIEKRIKTEEMQDYSIACGAAAQLLTA